MENNLEKKESEQTPKKQWISPEMEEINVNGGTTKILSESFAGGKS